MPKMSRFQRVMPKRDFQKRYEKRNKILKIQDTKYDKRGRKPLFILDLGGGFFSIKKKYVTTNRTTYGYSWEPTKQRRMLNIRKAKK